MTAAHLRDLDALTRAARLVPLSSDVAILGFVRGLLAGGHTDPQVVRLRCEAAGIAETLWRRAATWTPPVEVSRRSLRTRYLARHDAGRMLPP